MSLPNDIARCHDGLCNDRESCLRWIDRWGGDANTPHHVTFSGRKLCAAFRPVSLRAAHDIAGDAPKFDFHERKEH